MIHVVIYKSQKARLLWDHLVHDNKGEIEGFDILFVLPHKFITHRQPTQLTYHVRQSVKLTLWI